MSEKVAESDSKNLEDNKPNIESSILLWNNLIEGSSVDRATKDKLFSIIHDAEAIIGKPDTGAQMDKIGERLMTIKFLFEHIHDEHEEIDTLVLKLSTDIAKLHRHLLNEKY